MSRVYKMEYVSRRNRTKGSNKDVFIIDKSSSRPVNINSMKQKKKKDFQHV